MVEARTAKPVWHAACSDSGTLRQFRQAREDAIPSSPPSPPHHRLPRSLVVLVPSHRSSPPPLFSRILDFVAFAAIGLVAVTLASPFLSPLPSPSSLAHCPPYDGAGIPRHASVGSRRTRPHAGSNCPLLASIEGSLALTRTKCVNLMPSLPRVPKESPNSSC